MNNYLSRFNEKKYNDFQSNKQILILLTRCLFKQSYSKISFLRNHPFLKYSLRFYEKLENELKENSLVKIFPGISNEAETIKNIWKKKFKDNLSINMSKKKILDYYHNSRIVVIEEISTSFYELLHLNIPFIVISDEHQYFKKSFSRDFLKLSKINIIFEKPEEAANFINKNYDKLNFWWDEVLKNKAYKNFKKKYLPEKFKTKKFISNLYKK